MTGTPTEQAAPPTVDFDAPGLAKSLLRATPHGALATLDAQGQPFSTLTTVATDIDGRPLLLVSRLAAHTRHLEVDPRCSLLLARLGRGDPLAHPRLTLNGLARRLDRDTPDGARAKRRFLAAHPKAELYVDFPDFSFWRMDLAEGHLNGGFARAARLDGVALLTDLAGAEALVAGEDGAIAHMNADHADAVSLYATALLRAPSGRWRMTGIDPEGCDLAVAEERRRLVFPNRVDTPDLLRAVLVALARDARGRSEQAIEKTIV